MTVTLIVGCGDVGCRVAARLLTLGHKVYGLRRSISLLPDGVHPVAGDLVAGELGEWPEQIDYVVYCAAAGRQGEEGYRKIYLEGLEYVIRRLKGRKDQLKRIFFTSSTAVYHQNDGEWVDELSPTHPERFNGKIMLEAENLALDSDLPATVVRFGGIYGPGRNFMLRKIQSGEVYSSEPVVYGNRIHADDCAGMLVHLIELEEHGKCVHPLYLGVDSDPAPLSDVTQWLAEQLNVTPTLSTPGANRGGSKRCRNQRILDAGYRFRYPGYRDGYGALI
ncbi:SDR family oxidoreductase [Sansalvadorimonas verongulae]|uniref:SDR family oxidoreductase n=1 Tax=Sansalvadorimonas verongulae TaxID=2172824 RepID=UPI0012BCC209|nr:SDR family oxidoreductase [Sansalvadorimonas verongulae]MTI13092.1 SDR family oxidoreductase [Sansalvadorimonas verongulae]